MMNKFILIVSLVVICFIGLWLRYDDFKTRHPDNDELYELRLLTNDLSWKRVLDRKSLYGDHTSFPGEFLIYRPFIYSTSVKDWKIVTLDIEHMKVNGMERNDFWKLAIPKILICVVGMVVLGIICFGMGWGGAAGYLVYVLNPHLVYHAFDMRPYSVLPVLAVLNFIAASTACKRWLYVPLVIFTCIYHAYGLLIVLLPVLFFKHKDMLWPVVFGVMLWGYYASFNTFGWSANEAQAVVNSFQYFKPSVDAYLTSFLGQGFLYVGIVPIIILSMLLDCINWKFLSVFVLLPLLLIACVDIKTSYWIHPRQWVWVVPYFAMFCGNTIERLKNG